MGLRLCIVRHSRQNWGTSGNSYITNNMLTSDSYRFNRHNLGRLLDVLRYAAFVVLHFLMLPDLFRIPILDISTTVLV